jgi:hypothetical protein
VARFNTVLTGAADPFTWTLRLVGLLATLAVTVLVTRVARRALAAVPGDTRDRPPPAPAGGTAADGKAEGSSGQSRETSQL